jgi:hypothetical protein
MAKCTCLCHAPTRSRIPKQAIQYLVLDSLFDLGLNLANEFCTRHQNGVVREVSNDLVDIASVKPHLCPTGTASAWKAASLCHSISLRGPLWHKHQPCARRPLASVNFVASTLTKGASASFANRRAISVLPQPVGPIIRICKSVWRDAEDSNREGGN